MNAARDLRTKADHVERAFSHRIACMDEIRVKLENELVDVKHDILLLINEHLKQNTITFYLAFLLPRHCDDWPRQKS